MISLWIFLPFVKFPSHILSGTMFHLQMDLLASHSSCKQHFLDLEEPYSYCNSPHSLNITNPNIVLAVTAALCHLPMFTSSFEYANYLKLTLCYITDSSSTACPIFPSDFLQTKALENISHSLHSCSSTMSTST